MKILITCFQGLVPILNKELKRLGYKPFDTFQNGTYLEGNRNDVYNINLQSRIASKVYAQLGKTQKKDNFDDYFDYIFDINFKEIIKEGYPISIKATTKNSLLYSQKTIQSLTHKAIISNLVGKNNHRNINKQMESVDFFVKIENNLTEIYINTSGKSLHNRGYRTQTGEAPIKETIASALIYMGKRNFKQILLDPCCGSGTICIEAGMIATNTAPGLKRNFAFQNFKNYNYLNFKKIKTDLEKNIFEGNYEIIGTDIEPKMIEISNQNAKNAGMNKYIKFKIKNITEYTKNDFLGIEKTQKKDFFIITNPPYGKRIGTQQEIKNIYDKLGKLYKNNNVFGSFISSYNFDNILYNFKRKEINNNGELCMIYFK